MSNIKQRISSLREELKKNNIDAWFISGTDPHYSEYLPDRWKTREFISGFTGSYGVVVVTLSEAGLWTDSRYFLQADEQLEGSGIKMYKLRTYNAVTPEQWLKRKLRKGCKVGVDPKTITVIDFKKMCSALENKGIELVETADFFEKIWKDRPELPKNEIFELKTDVTGMTRKEKRELLVEKLEHSDVDLQVVTALDEVAWLFNLRGSDVAYNPVFMSYAIIGKEQSILFVDKEKMPSDLVDELKKEGICLKDYKFFFDYVKSINDKKIFVDPTTANYFVFATLKRNDNEIVEGLSNLSLPKAIKNRVELEGIKRAMKKDGVALIEFLYWLEQNVTSGEITEYSAARKLAGFRGQQKEFVGESFSPIMGYQEHGAIVHLSVRRDNALRLKPEGILLFDTGGQYKHGTTDITRTVALGPVTNQQKIDYTLVLKGMIALTNAKFPEGTKGCNIDILARKFLWEHGLSYGHGTGHGVGHFLNVHEGPISIRQEYNNVNLQPGMVGSNEPGIYREGQYGIRTENMIVCVEESETDFGKFYSFETLTICPIDTNLIELSLLTNDEKKWINNYHSRVKNELMPVIRKELKEFLEKLTKAI